MQPKVQGELEKNEADHKLHVQFYVVLSMFSLRAHNLRFF